MKWVKIWDHLSESKYFRNAETINEFCSCFYRHHVWSVTSLYAMNPNGNTLWRLHCIKLSCLCLNTTPWRRISHITGYIYSYSRNSMYIKISFKLRVFYPRRDRPSNTWIWSWFSLYWWAARGDEHITDTEVSLSFVFQFFNVLQSSSRSIFHSSCPFISPVTKVNSSVVVSSLQWA